MTTRRTTSAVAALALAASVAACGGSDDASSADTTAGTEVMVTTAGTEPTASDPMSTEPMSTEPTSTEPTSTEPTGTEPASTEPTGTAAGATETTAAGGATETTTAAAGTIGEAEAGTMTADGRWEAPSGQFSVLFPDGAEPEPLLQRVPVGGETLDVEFHLVELPDGAATAAQFDYSQFGAEFTPDLQGAVDGAIANLPSGEITSQTERTFGERTGIEYTFSFDAGGQPGAGRALVVLVDQSVIQLQAIAASADSELLTFIDTFELTEAGG